MVGQDGRDAPLGAYRAKRDFTITSEPSGAPGPLDTPEPGRPEGADPSAPRRFVVQRHRARRLHYDFRLEIDGVLVSWAVPKGPTLDPSVRSLAVHVEDHPLEYGDFEGIIPSGQYGAGDVIVWDRGTWEPVGGGDPAAAVAKGELHFDLTGEKLAGRFLLVRTRRSGSQDQWLMLHKRDEWAVEGWDPEAHGESVKSGKTNDQVAAAPVAVWESAHDWYVPTPAELAALDGLPGQGTWELQGRELALTNLDKVLFPGRDSGPATAPVTKRDLVRYYASVAPTMLPYLVDRPINLNRYPDGIDRTGFWHKALPDYAPDWIQRWRNPDAGPGESEMYAVIDSPPALAWLANHAAVELHAWTSRVPAVRRPTWALIDIDPGPETAWEDVVLLARLYRSGLEHLGLIGMPKVTGGRGLHVWVPIEPIYTFDQTRVWVEKLSRAVGAVVPNLVSWSWRKEERSGLARLDFTQNAINKTLVAPWSPRPSPGAPVSVPITWDELDDPDLRSGRWTLHTALERLDDAGDPFVRLLGQRQRLPEL